MLERAPHGMTDTGIEVDNPNVTRVALNTGVKCNSWPAVRAVNVEDHRVNCPDGTDDSDLEDGAGDMGFDPNDYEDMEELPSLPSTTASLLPPHVKAAWIAYHYEQQEQ